VTLGLVVDEPLDAVLSRLALRGVRVLGHSTPGGSVDIEDLDGNVITLWEARTLDSGVDLETAGSASRST
jgi:hypothetical protein